jgi:hypothetical protein
VLGEYYQVIARGVKIALASDAHAMYEAGGFAAHLALLRLAAGRASARPSPPSNAGASRHGGKRGFEGKKGGKAAYEETRSQVHPWSG